MAEQSPEHRLELLKKQFQEYAKDKEKLPFPPEIVTKITEEDLDFLKREVGISAVKILGQTIFGIYKGINSIFIYDAERGGNEVTPQDCLDGLRSLVRNGVPQAPLFLMVAEAYLSDRFKHHYLNRPISQPAEDLYLGDDFCRMILDQDFSNRTEEHAEKLIHSAVKLEEAVSKLVADLDDPEEDPETCWPLPEVRPLPDVVTWIERNGFQNHLVDFIKIVKEERKYDKGRDQHFYRRDVPMTQSPDDITDYFYMLLDGVTKLIQRNWPEKKYKKHAQPAAVMLFHKWGMKKVSEAGADRNRTRRKKKKDKLPP